MRSAQYRSEKLKSSARFPYVVALLTIYLNQSQGQDFQVDPQLKQLASYESVRIPTPSDRRGRSRFDLSHPSFSKDSKQVWFSDFPNSKLLRMDFVSGKPETISTNPRIYRARQDERLGGAFLLKLPMDLEIPTDRYLDKRNKDIIPEVAYFRSPELLAGGAEPDWALSVPEYGGLSIHWINEHQVYLIRGVLLRSKGIETEITVLHKNGKVRSRLTVEGAIFGIDSNESTIELFQFVKVSGSGTAVKSCQLNESLEAIARNQLLFYIPPFQGDVTGVIHDWTDASLHIRANNLRPGDVRHFVTEVMSKPGYWRYEDYSDIRNVYGFNPWSRVTPAHILKLRMHLRCYNLNGLTSWEHRDDIEVIQNFGTDYPAMLANHEGGLAILPLMHYVTDVTKVDGKYLIATEYSTSRPGKNTVQTSVYELNFAH